MKLTIKLHREFHYPQTRKLNHHLVISYLQQHILILEACYQSRVTVEQTLSSLNGFVLVLSSSSCLLSLDGYLWLYFAFTD